MEQELHTHPEQELHTHPEHLHSPQFLVGLLSLDL
jgi:hypothetical protein